MNCTVVPTGSPKVLALRYDWRNNAVLFVHNLGADPITIRLKTVLDDNERPELINMLSEDHSRADDDGRQTIEMEAYGYHWYRVGGLDYLLRRTDV